MRRNSAQQNYFIAAATVSPG